MPPSQENVELYEAIKALIRAEGINTSDAIRQVAEERGRPKGTVSAVYYRQAAVDSDALVTPSGPGRRGRPRAQEVEAAGPQRTPSRTSRTSRAKAPARRSAAAAATSAASTASAPAKRTTRKAAPKKTTTRKTAAKATPAKRTTRKAAVAAASPAPAVAVAAEAPAPKKRGRPLGSKNKTTRAKAASPARSTRARRTAAAGATLPSTTDILGFLDRYQQLEADNAALRAERDALQSRLTGVEAALRA